jgi:serine/threonine-protein kinase
VSSELRSEVAGYRLERELGRGSTSLVYLASDRFGHSVALKLLAPALVEDEIFRERFRRGARWMTELDHPNVLPIRDAGEENDGPYIVTRYIDGGDLQALLTREGSLSLSRTLVMLEQVASALDAAHAQGLIHRVVNASNILLQTRTDHAYLAGFTLALHSASPRLTKTGFFIGANDYAPPEQIEGLPVDARTDVYALGCLFYHCLTGSRPYTDVDSEVAVMHAHLTLPPPLLTSARKDLPSQLDNLLARAMAKTMDERYPTCGHFIAAAQQASSAEVQAPGSREAFGPGG